MKKAGLLKIELTYDAENEDIGVKAVCTQLFKK